MGVGRLGRAKGDVVTLELYLKPKTGIKGSELMTFALGSTSDRGQSQLCHNHPSIRSGPGQTGKFMFERERSAFLGVSASRLGH